MIYLVASSRDGKIAQEQTEVFETALNTRRKG
jgi:hypothetical protein